MNSKKQSIVNTIKELGYNQRQVSVKEGGGSLSWSFDVTVRDPKVNMEAVERAVKNHESVDRCQASGEILSGGNTFIFVRATDEVKAVWASEFLPVIQVASERLVTLEKNQGANINDNYSLSRGYNGYGYRLTYWKNKETCGNSVGYEYMTDLSTVAVQLHIHNQKIQAI